MHLEKLEIQGFKSFAKKNVLVFPGIIDGSRRGITAIVGPNGSGKSNIADAVRWALGEQSIKALRGKRSEDVIFSGSDRKSRLGMSEVSLFLNNEDRKAPVEYSQVVLTRRLFRDGESEYLINNSRTRLSDIQIFLAKAKFGQKTYSVIGQGMVEGFLNTTLAERKEFFDEATGVKQFQIKRDNSLNKLRSSYGNLDQVNMLLSEIEPRLRSLTRQVNKLKKRSEIEVELKELQLSYYRKIWHEINDKFNEFNNKFLELEKIKREKENKLKQFNNELDKIKEQDGDNEEFNEGQKKLSGLQSKKDKYVKELAMLDAQIEVSLEARGKFDLSWLHNKKDELIKQISETGEEIKSLEKNIVHEKNKAQELEREKESINKKINDLNNYLLKQAGREEMEEIKEINNYFKSLLRRLDEAEDEQDIEKIRNIIRQIRGKVKKFLELSEKKGAPAITNKVHEDLIKLTKAKEEIIIKINENNLRISVHSERAKLLRRERDKFNEELEKIEQKLRQNKFKDEKGDLTARKQNLEREIKEIEKKAEEIKVKINDLSKSKEEKTNRLFSLQKNLQFLQDEINKVALQLNELKINSTRYETRLEDLEIEIRYNLGGLNEVKENKAWGSIDIEAAREKINQLKRQMELIGGIDPETEKEYKETKERYDFLFGQVDDLTKAINSLEEIIRELDLIIKEKFDKEFKIISAKFEEYFKILFNGGTAKIIKIIEHENESKEKNKEDIVNLQEPSNIDISLDKSKKFNIKKIEFLKKHNATGLAGIEIQATPPGKKIKSVSMLSGGERALTAIALICAIISANPSPFVVLDEVDAALDEANSERLAKILDDLSHKTQFIIITHNRATMRRANVLYGVTMGNDGISKLLSIKLEEAVVE